METFNILHFSKVRESQFLDTIGTDQMEQKVQRRVIATYAKTMSGMAKETGIHSSVDENDIKSYLQDILERKQS